jgi:hypothetical protein
MLQQKQGNTMDNNPKTKFYYSRWRHGGWYVSNVRYPSGACGCVSRNYPDKKWRIVCDSRRTELGVEGDFTFPNRDAAAQAEMELAAAMCAAQEAASKGAPSQAVAE